MGKRAGKGSKTSVTQPESPVVQLNPPSPPPPPPPQSDKHESSLNAPPHQTQQGVQAEESADLGTDISTAFYAAQKPSSSCGVGSQSVTHHAQETTVQEDPCKTEEASSSSDMLESVDLATMPTHSEDVSSTHGNEDIPNHAQASVSHQVEGREEEGEDLSPLALGILPHRTGIRRPIHVIQVTPDVNMSPTVNMSPSSILSDVHDSVTPTPLVASATTADALVSPKMDAILTPPVISGALPLPPKDQYNPLSKSTPPISKSFQSRLSDSIPAFFTMAFSQKTKENLGPQWAHATAQPEVDQAILQIKDTSVTVELLERTIHRQRDLYVSLNSIEDELSLTFQRQGHADSHVGLKEAALALSVCQNTLCVDRLAVIAALDCVVDFLGVFRKRILVDLNETVVRQQESRRTMDYLCARYGELEEKHIKLLAQNKDDTKVAKLVEEAKTKFTLAKNLYIQYSQQVLDKTGLMELKREVDLKAHLENIRHAMELLHGREGDAPALSKRVAEATVAAAAFAASASLVSSEEESMPPVDQVQKTVHVLTEGTSSLTLLAETDEEGVTTMNENGQGGAKAEVEHDLEMSAVVA